MEGLVDQGINRIDAVTFQSSKLAQYQSEARKLAMKEAKNESRRLCFGFRSKSGACDDYFNSQTYYPQPVYATMKAWKVVIQHNQGRTLAAGEINITAKCNGKFYFRIKKLKL
jgi:uncharacterized protein YggE